MFNPFKNLFRRRSGNAALTKVGRVTPCAPSSPSPTSEDVTPHSPTNNAGPTASPSPGGEGWGEGEQITNSKLNPQNSTFPLDPDNKRNGKIAKLPRPLRDQINRALDAGQSAVSIARGLNEIPQVKAMLEAHFGGKPISQQNLSEWKAGGYRDWQLRQELILQHEEFAANIHELSQTAEGMANALFGMLLLDYARLMKNKDGETPEDFEKKRKALSAQLQDIVKLRRCDVQARNVEVQEGRLERDREKTAEEEFQKFTEWAENPAVRKAFILAPEARMAAQRRNFGMRPQPQDAAVLKEFEADSNSIETPENQENQTEHKPSQTEKSEADSSEGPIPSSPIPTSEDVTPPSPIKNTGPVASPSPGGEGRDEGELKTNIGRDAALRRPSAQTSENIPTTKTASLISTIRPIAPSPAPAVNPLTHTSPLKIQHLVPTLPPGIPSPNPVPVMRRTPLPRKPIHLMKTPLNITAPAHLLTVPATTGKSVLKICNRYLAYSE